MPHSSHDDRELVGGSEGKIFNGDKGGRVGVERMVSGSDDGGMQCWC